MIRRLKDLFHPRKFNDLDMNEIVSALQDLGARNHWVKTILDEIKDSNFQADKFLAENKVNRFSEVSARRNALVWVLEQILRSKTSVELERNVGNHQNQAEDPFEGLAVHMD